MIIPSGNLSLPKVTSKFIEDLIKQNAKSPLPRKSLNRYSYNKNMQHLTQRNTHRYTEADDKRDNSQFTKNHSQILDVTSPFYKRIQVKKVKNSRCQCYQLDGSHSLSLPKLKRSTCHQHQQIITKRIKDQKKYHQNLINSVRHNHIKIHQQIVQNQSKYVIQSLYKKGQIIAQKYVESKINEQYNQLKLEKLKFQESKRKQIIKTVLKDKLEQVYNLDNDNLPFEEILEKRNKWYKKEKIWAFKILNALHQELKQVRRTKKKAQESNNKKELSQIIQNEKILLDIQRSLAVILNNVQSIDELVIKGSVENINPQIQQIFYKNLEVKDRLYSRKLCKKLSQIIQKFYVPSKKDEMLTQVSENYQAQEEKIQQAKKIQPEKKQIVKKAKIAKKKKVGQQVNSKKISQPQTPSRKTEKTHQSTPPQSNTIHNQEETTTTNIHSTRNPKKSSVSIKSSTSKQSLSSKRSEPQSKALINAMINNKQSKNSIHLELKQNSVSNSHTQRSSKSLKSQISIKSMHSSYHGNQKFLNPIKETESIKISLIYNPHPKIITPFIIPSISKQVINEIDEFMVAQDDDFDGDDYDEYAREKALKFLRASKAAKQQEIQEQNQRIQYAIEYIKARIKLRKQNKFIIPKKYEKIKYQDFCTQKTFAHIASMIDEFYGQKKFTFLYGQLRLNQKILDDEYIEGVIETFKQMFRDNEQFEQWKDYLFEQRNKMIFFKLDRMIDLGMKEITDFQFSEETNDIPNLQQWMKERAVFGKVDESQIAYENFIQKMGRQKEKQKQTVLITSRESTARDEGKKKTTHEATAEEEKKKAAIQQIRNENRKGTHREAIVSQISQKSIKQEIEKISTKNIRYTIVENQRSIKIKKNGVIKLNKSYKTQEDQSKSGHSDKKKVLKYLFQKRPQEYEYFAKDVNEFSNYLKESFDQEVDEINEEIGVEN